jgi:DNA-binding MarR family transcriptional regulator
MMRQNRGTSRGAIAGCLRGFLTPGTYAVWVSRGNASGGGTGPQDGRQHGAQAATAVLSGAPVVDVTRLRVAIARLSRRLRKHELAGLTPTQLAALATVEQAGPLRLGDLAAAERIAPSTLTRLVSALEEHGYVQRHAVPGDARAWTLAVTERGHAVLDRIRQENTILLADSLLTLSPDQLAALAAALPALEQLADGAPPEAAPPEAAPPEAAPPATGRPAAGTT